MWRWCGRQFVCALFSIPSSSSSLVLYYFAVFFAASIYWLQSDSSPVMSLTYSLILYFNLIFSHTNTLIICRWVCHDKITWNWVHTHSHALRLNGTSFLFTPHHVCIWQWISANAVVLILYQKKKKLQHKKVLSFLLLMPLPLSGSMILTFSFDSKCDKNKDTKNSYYNVELSQILINCSNKCISTIVHWMNK